jgi:hypothetical protein
MRSLMQTIEKQTLPRTPQVSKTQHLGLEDFKPGGSE